MKCINEKCKYAICIRKCQNKKTEVDLIDNLKTEVYELKEQIKTERQQSTACLNYIINQLQKLGGEDLLKDAEIINNIYFESKTLKQTIAQKSIDQYEYLNNF